MTKIEYHSLAMVSVGSLKDYDLNIEQKIKIFSVGIAILKKEKDAETTQHIQDRKNGKDENNKGGFETES